MVTSKDRVRSALLKAAAVVRIGWCQGALARTELGSAVGPRSSSAVSWCAAGALEKICTSTFDRNEARYVLYQVICRASIEDWNDIYAKDAEQVARTLEEAAEQVHRVLETSP